jgi:flagellar protein FliO/FliZ
LIVVNHAMEFIDLLRYFGALLLVLAMVGGAGLLARRFGVPGVTKASSQKRLAIVETLMVGPRQRLFIVRRDDVEHLVLSGPDGATVIEAGISTPSGLRSASAATAISPFHASHKGDAGL